MLQLVDNFFFPTHYTTPWRRTAYSQNAFLQLTPISDLWPPCEQRESIDKSHYCNSHWHPHSQLLRTHVLLTQDFSWEKSHLTHQHLNTISDHFQVHAYVLDHDAGLASSHQRMREDPFRLFLLFHPFFPKTYKSDVPESPTFLWLYIYISNDMLI